MVWWFLTKLFLLNLEERNEIFSFSSLTSVGMFAKDLNCIWRYFTKKHRSSSNWVLVQWFLTVVCSLNLEKIKHGIWNLSAGAFVALTVHRVFPDFHYFIISGDPDENTGDIGCCGSVLMILSFFLIFITLPVSLFFCIKVILLLIYIL
jgi:hypothetical protein